MGASCTSFRKRVILFPFRHQILLAFTIAASAADAQQNLIDVPGVSITQWQTATGDTTPIRTPAGGPDFVSVAPSPRVTEPYLAAFAGDNLFAPLSQHRCRIGRHTYLSASRSFRAIGYGLPQHMAWRSYRSGIHVSLEEALTSRLSLTGIWHSRSIGAGYVTSGFGYKLTPAVTLLGGVQTGNSRLLAGNHCPLFGVRWTPNRRAQSK